MTTTDDTPTTTLEAYNDLTDDGDDASLRRQVAAAIAQDAGTTPEIAERFPDRSKNAIRPRVNELVRMECVRRDGKRKTAAGNKAFVHHITTRGERYVRGEIDPDPKPPLSELATDVVDAARAFLADELGNEGLTDALQQHDGAKLRRKPDWSPEHVINKRMTDGGNDTDGGDEIPEGLTADEYEKIQNDPVLTVDDVVNHG